VAMWRSRGEARVNTTGFRPLTPDPPPTSAGADSASIALVLHGPARTSTRAEWTVWPSQPRGIIYQMDVEAITMCRPEARECRPRVIRPMSNVLAVHPRTDESGMMVRARVRDPWWGYTHIPTPGSSWREWRVSFN
jgi:hypothetical protein